MRIVVDDRVDRLGGGPLVQDVPKDVVERDVDSGLGHPHGHEPLAVVVEFQFLRVGPADVPPPSLGPASTGQELNRAAPEEAIRHVKSSISTK